MAINRYVHADNGSSGDGTTAETDSSGNSAYKTIQEAIDDSGYNGPVADGNIFICDPPTALKYALGGTSVQCDIAGSGDWSYDDFRLKIIGCDASGDPYTTRGSRVTLDGGHANEVWDFIGDVTTGYQDNMYIFSLDFDAGGVSNRAVRFSGGTSYGWVFANCRFRNGTVFNTQYGSSVRGIVFLDCDFDNDDNTSINYGVEAAGIGGLFVNCKFKFTASGTGRLLHLNSLYPKTFVNCWFDANGESYCVSSKSDGGGSVFINNAFHNFSNAVCEAPGGNQFTHFINNTADGIDPAGDITWKKIASNDFNPGIMLGNLSNITKSLSGWGDLDKALDPYIASDSANTDSSTGGVISVTDPRWDERSEIRQGFADLYGVPGIIGPEHANISTVRGRVRQVNV